MTKYAIKGSNQSVELNDSNFIYKGGEGSIHIVNDKVYKICEPGKMIPEDKLVELSALKHERIIHPEEIVLQGSKPVGYTMRVVPNNAVPLAQILSKTFREREGVSPDHMQNLVKQIADGIKFIHKHKGYLQVDGNELNYMVTQKFDSVYFIDVNSFQTPTYPADAIMPSIRDWHCSIDPKTNLYQWSQLTDWYSFAIISFYMFSGIHPFAGFHPSFPNKKTFMLDQMKACKSVLDKEVKFPAAAVYHPFEGVIPGGSDGAFMQWYKAVFIDNKRLPPPDDFQAKLNFVTQIREIFGSNNFDIKKILEVQEAIIGFYCKKDTEVVVTKDNILVNNQIRSKPNSKFRIGFTDSDTPIMAVLENKTVSLVNLFNGENIPINANGTNIMSYNGTLYVLDEHQISEIQISEIKNKMIAGLTVVSTAMSKACKMYQGLAVHQMFGACFVSVFPEKGHHRQISMPELTEYQITEAKYENNVMMFSAMHRNTGRYDRLIYRFSKDWSSFDVRVVENIIPTGLNFTVLNNGICVCITEDEKVEIFSNQKDANTIKSIKDDVVKGDMKLCHKGTQVRFAKDKSIFSFSVKK